MKRFITLFLPFVFFNLSFFSFTFAYSCPNYFFSTDLAKGSNSRDVKVIQEILNLDKRTMVAMSGPGSPGNETQVFGVATREALKRFQALFIEYIGVANGKFGPKTRTSMNAVCKGPFFTNGTGNVFENTEQSTNTDNITPIVAVAGPTTADSDTTFRAYMAADEAIKTPDLSALIIFGGTASDLRKVSSTTFSFLVTPSTDGAKTITLQFEADKISDLAGNKNEKASNEWVVALNVVSKPEALTPFPNINLPVANNTDCSNVSSVDISDYSNPCYGKVPVSYGGSGNNVATGGGGGDSGGGGGGGGGGGMGQQIMQMLQGLLKSMGGAGGAGGGGKDGGDSGAQSMGDCSKLPTKQLNGKMGAVSGVADISANMGSGFWNGQNIGPAGPIYGFKLFPSVKACQQACPGVCMGACCNPQQDMMGRVVKFKIPGGSDFRWEGQ